jgi:PA domain/Secretion system C-terminal sorting domain
MKKLLLLFILTATGYISGVGQISFIVNSPTDIEGGYNFETVDTTGANEWNLSPDMDNTANAVTADLLIVDDGAIGDSLGCGVIINDLTGKIAVVYRGICEFGAKAKKAQDAGALAVIIINNVPGPPLGMLPGVSGDSVYIPVIMISQVTGSLIKEQIDLGLTVNGFIGNRLGLFENDLGFNKATAFSPKVGAVPSILAQNQDEYFVNLALFVYNYGSENQDDFTITATIDFDGSNIYNETSASSSINSGDTILVSLPDFLQDSYGVGQYTLTYTLDLPTDQYLQDNEYSFTFSITENTISLVQLDEFEVPTEPIGVRPGGLPIPEEFQVCMVFKSENADRINAKGMRFSASTSPLDSLFDKFMVLDVYEWNDEFDDVFAPTYNDISNSIATAIYDFEDYENLQNESIYLDFEDGPLALENNIRYLFCVTPSDEQVLVGHNDVINYERVIQEFQENVMLLQVDGTFYTAWAEPTYPTITIVTEPSIIGLAENETIKLNAFPNPSNDFITIPFTNLSGAGILTVVDISGKVVINKTITLNGENKLRVDISAISSGLYNFNLNLENGKKATIKVLVNK